MKEHEHKYIPSGGECEKAYKCGFCKKDFMMLYRSEKRKYCSYKCAYANRVGRKATKEHRLKITLSRIGDKNPVWKGNKVKKTTPLHNWVRRWKPKPDFCEYCHKVPPFDLANISDKANSKTYTRDFKNWVYICRRCHMNKDGRMGKIITRKLTSRSVRTIRKMAGSNNYSQQELGKMFQVSQTLISQILLNKIWKYV